MIIQTRIQARLQEFFQDGIDILISQRGVNGEIYYGEPVVIRQIPESERDLYRQPTLQIDTAAAQMLMDELWRCGLRPKEGTGSAGALAAVERHLADMQKIAMGSLVTRGVLKE